jgi:hypothetical protein
MGGMKVAIFGCEAGEFQLAEDRGRPEGATEAWAGPRIIATPGRYGDLLGRCRIL